jgi:hypothetical protein
LCLLINPTTIFFSVNTTSRGSDCDNLMSQDKMRDHRGTMLLRQCLLCSAKKYSSATSRQASSSGLNMSNERPETQHRDRIPFHP